MRRAEPASGTCFTQTAIFTARGTLFAGALRDRAGRISLLGHAPMARRRTTTRGVLTILLAGPRRRAGGRVARVVARRADRSSSPSSGRTATRTTSATPAPQGRHEGNDILAPKGSPAVAVEDGQDQVLDDLRPGRLHALSLRGERHHLPLHPPEQRPDEGERQPGQVRPRHVLLAGPEGRREGRRRAADRLRRRLRRCERDAPSPFRGAPERRGAGQPVPVSEPGGAPSLRGRARQRRDAVAEGLGRGHEGRPGLGQGRDRDRLPALA